MTLLRFAATGFATLMVLVPARALAAEEAAPLETERTWYGWQTASIAYGSLGLMGVALGLNHDVDTRSGRQPDPVWGAIGLASFAGYLLGPAIVHAIHGKYDIALGSLALSLGAPLAGGAAVGTAAVLRSYDTETGGGHVADQYSVYGAVAGMLAAPLVDAVFLAWQEDQVDRPRVTARIEVRREITSFALAASF